MSFNTYGAAQLIQADQTLLTPPQLDGGTPPRRDDNARSRTLGDFQAPKPGDGQCADAGLDREIEHPFAMVPANAPDGSRQIIVHLDKATPPASLTVANPSYINLSTTTMSGKDTTITITGNGLVTDELKGDKQHPTLTVTQGDSKMTLGVDVKGRQNKTVGLFGLYYANLPAPQVQSQSSTFPSSLAKELNRDLTAQANIFFTNLYPNMPSFPTVQPYSFNYATVNPGLGFHDPVQDNNLDDFRALDADFTKQVNNKMFVKQDLNGFYVQHIYPYPTAPGGNGEQGRVWPLYNYMAIIADPLGTNKSTQNTTTHEFAHDLGAADSEQKSEKKDLMYHNADTTNPCHLRRKDWNGMNHTAGPQIVDIAPKSGPPETTVMVSVQNLGATPGQLSLNGVSITVLSWTPGTNGYADIVTFVVPQGASSGPVQITASNGLVSTTNPIFTVTQ